MSMSDEARGEVARLISEATVYVDDLRLVVACAVAFNLGLTSRRDREPSDVGRLWDACERLGAVAGLDVDRTSM